MGNVATAFCATLVDEWVRGGLVEAFIAPGSRSTPLALALAGHPGVRDEIVLDERVAGFMALGSALASGRPAVVLTTSGTAVTHLHAAVVEAHLSEVPLLVCTADRPPELYGVGAAQTIEQQRIFGTAVRAYLDLGVPDEHNRNAWRSLAARSLAETTGSPAGPVQLNLSFREPLVGDGGPIPPGRSDGRPWHRRVVPAATPSDALLAELAGSWIGRRGVFLAGAGVDDPQAVLDLAEELGWPVLAEPRSNTRIAAPVVVAHADAIIRVPAWSERLRPEVVVQLGQMPASKVLAGWTKAAVSVPDVPDVPGPTGPTGSNGAMPAERVVVNEAGSWWDPDRQAGLVVACTPGRLAAALCERLRAERAHHDGSSCGAGSAAGSDASLQRFDVDSRPAGWLAAWRAADGAAASALEEELARGADEALPSEPAVARAAAAAAHRHGAGALVVSSSMPVRDLEWYLPRAPLGDNPPPVLSNRGANGIDGVVSTAIGAAVALAPAPVWVLIGDLAFLHDSNALLNLAERNITVRLVIVDNRGGGIFSFLPQASVVETATFERLFGTHQQLDPAALLRAHDIETVELDRTDRLERGLEELVRSTAAVAALVVRTGDRASNVAAHDRLHAAVSAALATVPPADGV